MKKIIIAAVVAIMGLTNIDAQTTFKFGNVDSQEILFELPETKQAQKELEDLQSKYESQIATMGEEFQKKYAELQAQADSLPQAIVEARYQEVQQLQDRIQNFQQMAQRDYQQQQQAKIAPIMEKIAKAIQTVGEREGFTYIFQMAANGIAYFDPKTTVDVAPLVKKELGIK
ncbi:MAG: OmpH family outer membrane protein [Bacteroidales bacterium]|nr:OmpH family outer membrane protein [Candidatus Liminaster caballi]